MQNFVLTDAPEPSPLLPVQQTNQYRAPDALGISDQARSVKALLVDLKTARSNLERTIALLESPAGVEGFIATGDGVPYASSLALAPDSERLCAYAVVRRRLFPAAQAYLAEGVLRIKLLDLGVTNLRDQLESSLDCLALHGLLSSRLLTSASNSVLTDIREALGEFDRLLRLLDGVTQERRTSEIVCALDRAQAYLAPESVAPLRTALASELEPRQAVEAQLLQTSGLGQEEAQAWTVGVPSPLERARAAFESARIPTELLFVLIRHDRTLHLATRA
jgi:hypothetical protein